MMKHVSMPRFEKQAAVKIVRLKKLVIKEHEIEEKLVDLNFLVELNYTNAVIGTENSTDSATRTIFNKKLNESEWPIDVSYGENTIPATALRHHEEKTVAQCE